MSEPGAKVPSGIDGISRSSAERQSDAPDQCGHQVGAQSGSRPRGRYGLRKDCPDDEDKDKGSDNFADQVCPKTPDGRASAETCEFQSLVQSFLPMRKKMEPHEDG